MAKYIGVYLAVLLAMLALDALWLGVIATEWYATAIGHLMAEEPSWLSAVVFYLLYPVGLVIFGVCARQAVTVPRAAGMGALFGLFAYATYDLTNLVTLADWPVYISALDMTWGSLMSGLAAAVGKLVLDRSSRKRVIPAPRDAA
jgi:uncharacterized membrane protein